MQTADSGYTIEWSVLQPEKTEEVPRHGQEELLCKSARYTGPKQLPDHNNVHTIESLHRSIHGHNRLRSTIQQLWIPHDIVYSKIRCYQVQRVVAVSEQQGSVVKHSLVEDSLTRVRHALEHDRTCVARGHLQW